MNSNTEKKNYPNNSLPVRTVIAYRKTFRFGLYGLEILNHSKITESE